MNLIDIFVNTYKGNSSRKLISRFYSALQEDRGLSTMYIKSRWEKDANIQLTEDDWLNICRIPPPAEIYGGNSPGKAL